MMIQNLSDLQQAHQQGKKFKYLPFWGHTPKSDNQIDKAVFSQWFPRDFVVDNIVYPTAEHFMMAKKAELFDDNVILAQILASKHPKQAKDLGRQIAHFDEQIWYQHREDIVFQANWAKFSQHEDLKAFLLNTGERILVEASPVDKIWGIGLAQDSAFLENPLKWQGLNLLGFALMKVRQQLVLSKLI
ncbi:NADAR family protein [Alysiella crassa]|uniref:NADAR family protein n=1 Tax=Alysiella crassa TaxID=153491 RepID=UPI000553A217|nr:NADAR family protein [Alysiella crassa]